MNSEIRLALVATLHEQLDPSFALLFELLSYEQIVEVMIVLGGKDVKVPRLSDMLAGLEAAVDAIAICNDLKRDSDDPLVKRAVTAVQRFRSTQSRINSRERELLDKLGV